MRGQCMGIYEALVIPGGGLLPDGQPTPWVKARLKAARELANQTNYILLLSAGTVHKPPPLNPNGFPILESAASASYLLKQGLSPDQLLIETCSYDTIGNAYFSRMVHAEPGKLSRLLVITSEFHLARTKAAFEWVYGLSPLPFPFQLEFIAAPNQGLEDQALEARRKREKSSLEKLLETREKITTLAALHHWLHTEHSAYNSSGAEGRARGSVLDSY